jgi:hypothetical protein
MTRMAHEFLGRVLRSSILRGFEIQVFWYRDRKIVKLRARHPYGRWHKLNIFDCGESFCTSENGTLMVSADVSHRLKQLMTDGGMKKGSRIKHE